MVQWKKEGLEGQDEGAIRMSLLHGARYRRGLRKWQKAAHDTSVTDVAALRRTRARVRALLTALSGSTRAGDTPPAAPTRVRPALPHGTDWSWRPEVWQAALPEPDMGSVRSHAVLGGAMAVFHDGAQSEFAMRQTRNAHGADRAPYGLQLDVFAFEGSFLSLVLDLPHAAMDGLTRRHLVRLDTIVELEKPLKIFARLNVKHGPNIEQIVRQLPIDSAETMVEFDLAYSNVNEKRLDRAWIDLIFEAPHMTGAALRDIILSRRLRADL